MIDCKISVVVPVYNVENYLNRCIESIINQTYLNLEIILVDDGSTDSSGSLCDLWAEKDKRISVIHKQNAGLGMARNSGLELATGDYIFFWDSDDYVDITLVEKCLKKVNKYDADVVIYGRTNVDEDGLLHVRKMTNVNELFEGEDITKKLLPTMFTYELGIGVSAWSKMYRLSTFKDNNIKFKSEREIISEDAYFSLELFSQINKVSILNENLYFYYKRKVSLSRIYKKDRPQKNNEFLLACIECAEKANLPTKILYHIKSRYHGLMLGTMMQIMTSELSKKEKKEELYKILKDPILKETLDKDVINLDGRFPRLFWKILKFKCYIVCVLLLKINTCRKLME